MAPIAAEHNDTFTCAKCHEEKPVQTSGGTGYGSDSNGDKVCYTCCALEDMAYMRQHGKITLYLTQATKPGYVSNWPGTLKLPVGPIRKGHHNLAGVRYDVWFMCEGQRWHGAQYGNNTQLLHCRRVKG